MNRKLRYGLTAAAAVVALLAALPFVLPASVYKEPIERSVTSAAGRGFTIAGPLHFTLFPALGLSAGKVALANPAGWPRPSLATAEELRIAVRFQPLLAGRIEVSEIVVEKPQIDLAVDAAGHANWTLARSRAKSAAKGSGGGNPGFTASFSHMTIEGGSLTYYNARTKSAFAIGDLDAAVTGSGYDAPVSLAGSFSYRGRKVDFGAKASAPRAVLEEKQADVGLSLNAALLQTEFHGRISTDGSVQGHAAMKSPSIREAGAWLGAKLPATGGLGAFALSAAVAGDNRHAELTDMKLALDGATITGALSVDTHAPTPELRGMLDIDALDLNPYIEAPRSAGAAPHPRHDPEQDEEWRRDPIRLDALHKFNGELSIETGSMHVRNLALGRTRMNVSLADGALHAHLGPMTLYGGSGTADVEVDARGPAPAFHDTAAFDNVALQPFLADTIGVKQIEGTGTIRLDASSHGATADAIMHGLAGKGSIALRDGRLRGVDLGTVAHAIQRILNGAIGPGSFTDYSAMSGSFTVAGGVLTSNDFHLKGPLLETTGSGAVDIGDRAIDFRIVPVVLKLGLPFRIEGPWKHVHYTPDLKGIVAGVLGNLESGKAPFKGLFGRSSKPDPNAPKKKHKSVGAALKNMLGIH
jgi:AsmA protein